MSWSHIKTETFVGWVDALYRVEARNPTDESGCGLISNQFANCPIPGNLQGNGPVIGGNEAKPAHQADASRPGGSEDLLAIRHPVLLETIRERPT
jgi:hypothetical protein